MSKSRGISRRDAIRGMVAAGAATVVGDADAQTAPTDAITTADVAAVDKVAGRSNTEPHRRQMLKSLTETRDGLIALRAGALSELDEPATRFDPRLPGVKPPTGKSGVRLSAAPTPHYDGHPDSLAFATAVELSRLIRARKVSSMELTRMALERLKRYGPALRCVVNLTEERALQQAARADREIAAGHYRGPLHGIPWGAKDLLATRGIPTTYGVRPFERQVLDYDATVVERLDRAGAVLVAKLSLGELAMGDVWFGGMTRNPWKPETGSSGSSAGPASALAAGLVGFAIGSETLGSIVSPSVRCGCTGLRPTFGRVSRFGAMPLSWTMDKLGPMARGVEDCAIVLGAIHGPDGRDRTVPDIPFRWNPAADLRALRVGYDEAAFQAAADGKDKAAARAYNEALDVLRGLGVALKPIRLPAIGPEYEPLAGLIIGVEGAASFARLTASGGLDQLVQQDDDSWPNTFRVAATIPAVDYVAALRLRRRLQAEMQRAMEGFDCYVTPPYGSLVLTNLTGHPTLITRCGMADGMPLMVEFTGALYREDAILRVALAFEQATRWHTQWPDLSKLDSVKP